MKKVGTILLADGATKSRSGEIEVSVDAGSVVLRIHKHHEVSFRFTPTMARRIGGLLLDAAGSETPDLKLVK